MACIGHHNIENMAFFFFAPSARMCFFVLFFISLLEGAFLKLLACRSSISIVMQFQQRISTWGLCLLEVFSELICFSSANKSISKSFVKKCSKRPCSEHFFNAALYKRPLLLPRVVHVCENETAQLWRSTLARNGFARFLLVPQTLLPKALLEPVNLEEHSMSCYQLWLETSPPLYFCLQFH